MTVDDLWAKASELPEGDRAALVHRLLLSLDRQAQDSGTDAEWEAAWVAEVEARAERLDSGQTTARDWREVMADIQASLAKRRTP